MINLIRHALYQTITINSHPLVKGNDRKGLPTGFKLSQGGNAQGDISFFIRQEIKTSDSTKCAVSDTLVESRSDDLFLKESL